MAVTESKEKDTVQTNGDALSRRSFVKWGAALSSVPVLGQLVACAPGETDADVELSSTSGDVPEEEGEWRPYRCVTQTCAASCICYALVKDGQVVRVKSDDRNPDSWELPQQRGCLRGQARKSFVYAPDRLKYPMKRKNWEPGGGKKELRGKDEWVRISWDEALDILASEVKRIKEAYGSEAFLQLANQEPAINAYGGSMAGYGVGSAGGWLFTVNKMTGMIDTLLFDTYHISNDRIDLMNSKLIVLFGSNPAWSSQGFPNYILLEAKRRGAKIICVDPFYNNTAATVADQWIPIRPSTDATLLLACAYVMIEGNLQDQDFLDTYCVGFDADHMPEGADPKENFKDYVLGTYDGQPKTPEWATEICGVSPDVIRQLATDMATIKPASLLSSAAPARAFRGEQYAQSFLTVGWMTGNVGKPGAQVADAYHINFGNGGNDMVPAGASGEPGVDNPVSAAFAIFAPLAPGEGLTGIPLNEQWKSVLEGEYTNGVLGKQKCNIQAIFDLRWNNYFNQNPGIFKGIEAFRKVEFVATADSFLTPSAQYSDLVLPITMNWERTHQFWYSSNRETLTYSASIIDPLFESKDDWWVTSELAKRLDIDPDTVTLPLDKVFYNKLSGATVMKEQTGSMGVSAGSFVATSGQAGDGEDGDNGYETLFTITEEDLKELGVEGEPQTGRVDWQTFKKEGIYQLPRSEGDGLGYIAFEAYINDPVANPLNTASGKFEIYCQALSDAVASFGTYEIPPIAKYEPPQYGYQASFENFESRTPGKYPLQMISPHYIGRMHSTFDNSQWLRQAHPQAVFMNPLDAEARGIANGDGVKLHNEFGAVVREVKVTPRVIPGVVLLPEGGLSNVDDELGIDFGGNPNSLTPDEACGSGIQPWNTVLVEAERWEQALAPASERALRTYEVEE